RASVDRRTVTSYGFESIVHVPDVVATDVHAEAAGSRFVWRWPGRRLERQVIIPLLGRHQVLNVTVALAVVHELGYSLDAAVAAAASLEPVEHRLQIMPTGGAITVIDDSYNANPVGVHDGLDVLAAMNGGAKLLVTPGLVELGSAEDAENRRYGAHAAAVCDHVIVVAARTSAALTAGLEQGGLAEDRIHIVRDLQQASAVIARVAHAGGGDRRLPASWTPVRTCAGSTAAGVTTKTQPRAGSRQGQAAGSLDPRAPAHRGGSACRPGHAAGAGSAASRLPGARRLGD